MSYALPDECPDDTAIHNLTDPACGLLVDLTLEQAMGKYLAHGTQFKSKNDLHCFLNKLSSHYMFGISTHGQRFECKQGPKRKKKKKNPASKSHCSSVSLRIGCNWHVSFTGKSRIVKGNDSRAQYDFTLPVLVTGCNCNHSHGISKQNMVAVFKGSGDLFQNLSSHAMF